jgi:exopolysaccharide/PEP-CTERM locus tyrosine autokinase
MMSLIEQAAKRLEELRRTGATPGDEAAEATTAAGASQPTPESVVRMLEARNEALGDPASAAAAAGSLPERGAAPFAYGPLPRRASRASGSGPRIVDIDLEGLKARGFVTPDAPTTQIADEFRLVKRPIIQNAMGRGGRKIRDGNLVMVASAIAGEGKTFTAVNLAISIAMEYDNTVLLVDGDVAKPALPKLLGVPESPGLLDLLTSDTLDVSDALVKTNIEKLSVLPAGTSHRRSTELLASEQMARLLQELATRYTDRIVIFDSPPILRTTESRELASHMGQIVMVVAAESTSRNVVNQALAAIETCDLVMMLLNKASTSEAGAYGYYYRDAPR